VERKFDHATAMDGMRQILWGMFKKVVVADNAALIVDAVFAHYENASPIMLFLGAAMFFIQVYGDFSGYSDIAIGTAKLFGFKLSLNFASPFFSRSFAEFWRRWHITLNEWFRDYVYFPLGGNRKGQGRHYLNITIVFVVCGFWHGAAWTFVLWGLLNALYFIAEQKLGLVSKNEKSLSEIRFPRPGDVFKMLVVFSAISVSLVFFRSPDIESALNYFLAMVDFTSTNSFHLESKLKLMLRTELPFYVTLMLFFEWKNRGNLHGLATISRYRVVRFGVYLVLTILCTQYFYGDNAFVYFQF
jgi:alginate O-acetyltransferase complex protein AlgI